MPTTPSLALPYPAPTATPDVPYDMQQLAEAVEAAMGGRPRCRLSMAAAGFSTTSGVATTMDFAGGAVDYDNNAMADIANDRIVIKTAGWYRFTARLPFTSNATGYRALLVHVNGSVVADIYYQSANGAATIGYLTTDPILCAVNDAVTMVAVQNCGGAMTVGMATNGKNGFLAAHWEFKA